jgi:hypothetical protein
VIEPVLLASVADALAREPSGEEVDGLAAMSDVSNIVKDSGIGPAFGEDVSTLGVPLAEPAVVDAGEREPEVE